MTDWSEWSRQAVAAMQARNDAWVSRFGLARAAYRWDLATAELRFERAEDEVVADLCLVGTVSEAEGTFLWAWDNDEIPRSAKQGLEAVRTFGVTNDLPLLTTPAWPGARADGLEMLAVAGQIQNASGRVRRPGRAAPHVLHPPPISSARPAGRGRLSGVSGRSVN